MKHCKEVGSGLKTKIPIWYEAELEFPGEGGLNQNTFFGEGREFF